MDTPSESHKGYTPPSLTTSSPPEKVKRTKRTLTEVACGECRARKAKCDGGRPRCTRCVRGNKACAYSVNPGETRQEAARTKTEKLEKDYDSVFEVLETLRTLPLIDARGLLGSLRASRDTAAFLDTFKARRASCVSVSPTVYYLHRSSISVKREDLSSRSSSNGPFISPDQTTISRKSRLPDDMETITEFSPAGSRLTDELPDQQLLRKTVGQFYASSGKLSHVFKQEKIEFYIDNMFQNDFTTTSKRQLCEVCCVAAVGVLYMQEPCEAKDDLHLIAQTLMDDAIRERPLEAAKCCTLLGIYNIMSKATVALGYIEMGMDLCRNHRVHMANSNMPPNVSQEGWLEWRRAWRSLLFLGSWLSSTLGYDSTNDWMLEDATFADVVIPGETEISDVVQTEMVKIAILNREIIRVDASAKGGPATSYELVLQTLHQWHQDMPGEMRLTNLLENPDITKDIRVSIYTVHLLYLGALMLIYRTLLKQPRQLIDEQPDKLRQVHTEAVTAAQQSSRIFSLLRQDNGVHQRCWLSIFQAYCASILILYGIAERLTYPDGQTQSLADDLNQARRCIDVLRFCGEVDEVAAKFCGMLQPYYKTLESIATTTQYPHTAQDIRLRFVCTELFNLVRKPFVNTGFQTTEDDYTRETTFPPNQSQLPHGSHNTKPFTWDKVDGFRRDGKVHDLLSTLEPAKFLDSSRPHGWAEDALHHPSAMDTD